MKNMICNCGKAFKTACEHADHKREIKTAGGEIDDHRCVCSICKGKLPHPISHDFAGIILQSDFGIFAIFCESCSNFIKMLATKVEENPFYDIEVAMKKFKQ